MVFWYGMVPVLGAFVSRRSWRDFRRRFDDLRLHPLLNYAAYRQGKGGLYRFIGGFESVTDGRILWIRGEDLTIPVVLTGAHTYMLPVSDWESEATPFDPGKEAPKRVHWNRVTTLTDGAKVYVGGPLTLQNERWTFASSREYPLQVIFYDGSDRILTSRVIRAGRHRNEYWNFITPYAFILGAFCQILLILNYLPRPAFRLTVITAFTAVFIPLFPLIPPGILCTALYRRLWRRARILRAYRDLIRLPLKYLSLKDPACRLPNGELYGAVFYPTLPSQTQDLPLLLPAEIGNRGAGWYVFGILSDQEPQSLPQEPADVFAPYGILPGDADSLAQHYTFRAYTLEIISWLALLFGIGLNSFFLGMIISLFGNP